MSIKIIIFGRLCAVLGESLELDNVADTDRLRAVLEEKYPELGGSTFAMAVNKKMVTENTLLTQGCTVALLPPFSGG